MIDSELHELESNYFDQPLMGQVADLKKINEIRARLKMPLVDSALRPPTEKKIKVKPVRDLTRARALYAEYKVKRDVLVKHREYAQKVILATAGSGQTPVMPLATMGCDGKALLCDYCKKPIILEGGKFHNVPVDVAWAKNPDPTWLSYIKGGLMVEMQCNGTVRIYHGYPSNKSHCCEIAAALDRETRSKHVATIDNKLSDDLLIVIKEEHPNPYPVFNDLFAMMFCYDPGLGVNYAVSTVATRDRS